MKSTKQMSESIRLGAILAVSGGFMDAYSYIQRDEVFANAQTGNMLLFGVKLSEGNFAGALQYFFPFSPLFSASLPQSLCAGADSAFCTGGRYQ